MDIAFVNNNSSTNSIPVKTNNQITDTATVKRENKTADQFDYSKVMMNLDEIQDFLFLLIGSDNPVKQDKGSHINLTA
jgi:hypothetical protein